MTSFTESHAEEAALAWLDALGYAVLHGPEIAVRWDRRRERSFSPPLDTCLSSAVISRA